jgi:hypothetical protein
MLGEDLSECWLIQLSKFYREARNFMKVKAEGVCEDRSKWKEMISDCPYEVGVFV